MDSLTSLTQQLQISRKELKNIRQDMQKLKAIYNKDILNIRTCLFSNSSLKSTAQVGVENISKISNSALETSELSPFHMKPIGYIESCFKTKNGTPRQASLCPDTKACLKISRSIFFSPKYSLEGLKDFSHIWVLFVFHQNGPVRNVKPKVHPPRLNGSSVGVFATRSPHRPNPIGLSLIKLDKVEGRTVYLSGVDLIDGTPVLDIKPFIPAYDSPSPANHLSPVHESSTCETIKTCSGIVLPEVDECYNDNALNSYINSTNSDISPIKSVNISSATDCFNERALQPCNEQKETVFDSGHIVKTAPWLLFQPEVSLEVNFTRRAESDLSKFHCKNEHEGECIFCLNFLAGNAEAKSSIINILQNDPRSVYRRTKCSDRLYYCSIDSMHITCWFDEGIPLAEVLRVQPVKKMKSDNKVTI